MRTSPRVLKSWAKLPSAPSVSFSYRMEGKVVWTSQELSWGEEGVPAPEAWRGPSPSCMPWPRRQPSPRRRPLAPKTSSFQRAGWLSGQRHATETQVDIPLHHFGWGVTSTQLRIPANTVSVWRGKALGGLPMPTHKYPIIVTNQTGERKLRISLHNT